MARKVIGAIGYSELDASVGHMHSIVDGMGYGGVALTCCRVELDGPTILGFSSDTRRRPFATHTGRRIVRFVYMRANREIYRIDNNT